MNDYDVILISFEEQLLEAGNALSNLGDTLMPYSFFAYFIFRFLAYKLGTKYSRNNYLLKSIWYMAYGIMVMTNDVSIDIVVMFIAFIEAIDLLFKYIEEGRKFKNEEKGR